VKALTIRQPWASLVALGVKTIETRSWSTKYRGPLLIHAGMKMPGTDVLSSLLLGIGAAEGGPMFMGVPDRWWDAFTVVCPTGHVSTKVLITEKGHRCLACGKGPTLVCPPEWSDLPLGAIVASCTLADVVPIVGGSDGRWPADHDGERRVFATNGLWITRERGPAKDISDQLPYGDFTPGRFAWLLEDVKPLDPTDAKGGQRLWWWAP
jgi:hypothetical protein